MVPELKPNKMETRQVNDEDEMETVSYCKTMAEEDSDY